MRDADLHPPRVPASWGEAFAALPQESPPDGGWNAVAGRLDARRRTRAPLWLAMAAAIALLAIALPWRIAVPGGDGPAPQDAGLAQAQGDPMEALYAESARLETLLAVARDDRFGSGTALALASEYESRLAAIDAALRQPGLSREQRQALWQERVDSLRTLAGFESNRRWLQSQGTVYDAALVLID